MTDTPQLNQAHLDCVMDFVNQGAYYRHINLVLRELRPAYARLEADLLPSHLNSLGGLHGGVYASIIDSAAFWAIYCELEEKAAFITLDLKLDILASIRSGTIVAEGRSLKIGRRVCLAEALVRDGREGRLLAHGSSKLLVAPDLESISSAMAAQGLSAPPPKFLAEA